VPAGISSITLKSEKRYTMQSGDYCHVDAASDKASWTNDLGGQYSGASGSSWVTRTVNLSAGASAGHFIKIRFRLTSNGDGLTDLGWQADNIRLVVNQPSWIDAEILTK
jgi:hypothetical protein